MSDVNVDQDLQRCRTTAYTRGIEQGLVELHDLLGPAAPLVGQGGYSILPQSLHDLLPGVNEEVARQATDTGELIIAKSKTSPDKPWVQWWMGVAYIRLGAVERLNKQATDRLAGRKVRGRPTISLPLVRASVADVAAAVAEAFYLLADTAEGDLPRSQARFDDTIDGATRASLKLFGASGYVVGPAANLAYAITGLGDVYGDTDKRCLQ